MNAGTRWRIVADYWAGAEPQKIAQRYRCDHTYPACLAHRRGFIRGNPDTRRKLDSMKKAQRRA